MSCEGTGRLAAIRLPAIEGADALRSAWERSDAVLVLDPRAPGAEVDRILERMRPEEGVEPEVVGWSLREPPARPRAWS